MTLDIAKFCGPDPTGQFNMTRPFVVDGVTYATDRAIVVAVDTPAMGNTRGRKVPPVASLINSQWPTGKFTAWESTKPRYLPTECPACKGHGKQRCQHCGDGHSDDDCLDCDGKGEVKTIEAYKLGSVVVAEKYYRLVASLPGPVRYRVVTPKESVAFTFDGGRGLLMGLSVD